MLHHKDANSLAQISRMSPYLQESMSPRVQIRTLFDIPAQDFVPFLRLELFQLQMLLSYESHQSAKAYRPHLKTEAQSYCYSRNFRRVLPVTRNRAGNVS